MALAHGNPADLLPDRYKEQIKTWFAEDAPSFDYGMFQSHEVGVVADEES